VTRHHADAVIMIEISANGAMDCHVAFASSQ